MARQTGKKKSPPTTAKAAPSDNPPGEAPAPPAGAVDAALDDAAHAGAVEPLRSAEVPTAAIPVPKSSGYTRTDIPAPSSSSKQAGGKSGAHPPGELTLIAPEESWAQTTGPLPSLEELLGLRGPTVENADDNGDDPPAASDARWNDDWTRTDEQNADGKAGAVMTMMQNRGSSAADTNGRDGESYNGAERRAGTRERPPAVSGVSSSQPMLFEVAWEVCWQLGGIYTVMRSKAPQMTKIWGDRYCLVGPLNADTAAVELDDLKPTGHIAAALEKLSGWGVKWRFGRWLITGKPQVILLDFGAAFDRLGEFKHLLQVDHHITAREGDWEINNVVVFGFLVGMFFQAITEVSGIHLPVLAHFHEWMAGLGLMRIKKMGLPVATVFTTHATILGRYLCTDNPDFYQKLPWINPDQAAGHYAIYDRYSIERGAANCADVFTTVSDITGLEAEKLLARKPDVLTPNGLNIQKFAALHEFQNLHKTYKEKISQFVAGHFFPSYNFDLDRTIYLFTSGRYEYGNKGYNLFLEALARLNYWLKAGGIPVTVVAFLITRAPTKSINVDVLKAQAMHDELEAVCGRVEKEMGANLLKIVSEGRLPDRGDLLTDEAIVTLKRAMHAWRTWKQPSIVTHDLWDDANDPVLAQLRVCKLFNAKDDPVKIVFHPDFVSATSPLIGLDYDQFVRGCHMGVFPSYYEPWGYTPMECVASGVPAVTSDLAGFGSYVLQNIPDPPGSGLFVIGRRYASFDQSAHQLTETLFNFVTKDRRARIEMRNKVERLSDNFDWSALISHYTEAHRMAIARKTAAMAG
jgi:glycogen(starch) synthase